MRSGRKIKKKTANKGSSYRPEFCEQLKVLVIDGGMVNQRGEIPLGKIARFWKVSEKAIQNWRNPKTKYYIKEFADAWKKCRKAAEAGAIKRGLIQRAMGYTSKHVITEENEGPDGKEKKKRTEMIEHPPDVQAAKVCLHNLGRAEDPEEKWNVKEQVEQSGAVSHVVTGVNKPALKKLADAYVKEVLNAGRR